MHLLKFRFFTNCCFVLICTIHIIIPTSIHNLVEVSFNIFLFILPSSLYVTACGQDLSPDCIFGKNKGWWLETGFSTQRFSLFHVLDELFHIAVTVHHVDHPPPYYKVPLSAVSPYTLMASASWHGPVLLPCHWHVSLGTPVSLLLTCTSYGCYCRMFCSMRMIWYDWSVMWHIKPPLVDPTVKSGATSKLFRLPFSWNGTPCPGLKEFQEWLWLRKNNRKAGLLTTQ